MNKFLHFKIGDYTLQKPHLRERERERERNQLTLHKKSFIIVKNQLYQDLLYLKT